MPAVIWTTKFVATLAAAIVVDGLLRKGAASWTARRALKTA
jgi:hypothetical protein